MLRLRTCGFNLNDRLWRDKLDWKERQSGLEKSAEARG